MTQHLERPRSHRFDAGTVELHCLDYGDREAPPVVLLHGHTDSAWAWHHISVELAEHHRVIALDMRGHGDSGRGAYTAAHLVGDVLALVEFFSLERPAFLAHSLGGHVATQMAGAFPDIAARMVLVEALGPPRAARVSDEEWRTILKSRIEGARPPGRRPPMVDLEEAYERFRRQHRELGTARLRFVVEHLVRRNRDGGVEWKFDPLSRDWIVSHDHERVEALWRGVVCPVLHVLGAEAYERFWSKALRPAAGASGGPITAAELERRLACFADQRLVVLDDCGHMPHYEQPKALLEAISAFLAIR